MKADFEVTVLSTMRDPPISTFITEMTLPAGKERTVRSVVKNPREMYSMMDEADNFTVKMDPGTIS